jgi:hypothetical protein
VAHGAQALHQVSPGMILVGREPAQRAHRAEWRSEAFAGLVARVLERRRSAPREPERRRLALLRGLGCHQHADEIDAGDAVDHAMMRLAHQRDAVPLEALHQPQLPERLVEVETLLEDARAGALQQPLVARLRQARVADVVADVEAWIVHPDRMPVDGRRFDALAVARDQVQARGHVLEDALDVEHVSLVTERTAFTDQDRADVHRRVGALVEQERVVELGESRVGEVAHGFPPQSFWRVSNSCCTSSTKSCRSGTASQSALKPQKRVPS